MAGKYEKKKTRKRKKPLIPVLIVLVLILVVAGVLLYPDPAPMVPDEQEQIHTTAETEETEEQQTAASAFTPLMEQKGIRVAKIESYTGAYMEDGSDEIVSGVLAILVENNSGNALQYAQITLSFPQGDARFTVSTLPAGEKAMLLESNRMAYTDEAPTDLVIENVAVLSELEMHEDLFRISGMNGVLNVKNTSGKDINGTISVYYKNKVQDLYYGGITYRAKIEGGLKAEEIYQIPTKHYNPDNCEILMVTYSE